MSTFPIFLSLIVKCSIVYLVRREFSRPGMLRSLYALDYVSHIIQPATPLSFLRWSLLMGRTLSPQECHREQLVREELR